MDARRTPAGIWTTALAAATALGCYESHGLAGGDDATSETRDAADDGATTDDGHDDDGGAGDGARPPEGVEPLGGPVQLDDETLAGGRLGLAWNGDSWGVVWLDDRPRTVVFRDLAPDLGRLGPVVALGPDVSPERLVLARGPDRYGVAWHDGGHATLATLDDAGRVLVGPLAAGNSLLDLDLAWWPSGGSWLMAWTLGSGTDELFELQLTPFDDALHAGTALPLGDPSPSLLGTRLATAGPWVGVAWRGRDGSWFRAVRPDDPGVGAPRLSVPATSADGLDLHPPVLEGWGESFVLATLDGSGPSVTRVDAASGTILAGPRVVGASPMLERRPALRAAPERGALGVCYQTGPYHSPGSGGEDGLAFQLVSPDAAPLGEPLALASDLHMICDCALAWSGRELLAVWWSCGGDARFNTVWGQRLRIVP